MASLSIWNFPACPATHHLAHPLHPSKRKNGCCSRRGRVFAAGMSEPASVPPELRVPTCLMLQYLLYPAPGTGAQPQKRESTAKPNSASDSWSLGCQKKAKAAGQSALGTGAQRSRGVGVGRLVFTVLCYAPGDFHTFFRKLKEITHRWECTFPRACPGLHGDISLREDRIQRLLADEGLWPCGNIQIFCLICYFPF